MQRDGRRDRGEEKYREIDRGRQIERWQEGEGERDGKRKRVIMSVIERRNISR